MKTCNPSTIVGQIATPTDDTCTASIPFNADREAVLAFARECEKIGGTLGRTDDGLGITCTFPAT